MFLSSPDEINLLNQGLDEPLAIRPTTTGHREVTIGADRRTEGNVDIEPRRLRHAYRGFSPPTHQGLDQARLPSICSTRR